MMKKLLLLLFFFASFSFAAWQETAGLAIIASLMLIVLVYMIGYGFGIDMLTVTAKDEIYQLLVLIVMMAVLFGTNGLIDDISSNPTLAGSEANMQTTALLSLNDSIEDLSDAFSDLKGVDKKVGEAGALGMSCNLQGMGYFVSGCGGFSMIASPFSLAGSIMGFAIGELNAVYRLVDLALNYALSLLLPFGIILRTFRFTRGAGGFLIAIGISMHLLLPMGILFVDILGESFLDSSQASGYKPGEAPLSEIDICIKNVVTDSTCIGCEGGDTGDLNSDRAIYSYDTLRQSIKSYLYLILIKATLGPIVAVMMMVAGIRYLSSMAGAEVDVSALARVI